MKQRPYTPPPYGQHFLHDRNILNLLVKSADLAPGDEVLEIGAGTGKLTEMILGRGARVTAVEVDADLGPGLEEKFARDPSFGLVKGDALRLPWKDLLSAGGRSVVMGNLPYAISTQVFFRVLENRERVRRAVFLMQKEVAIRMTADPGNKDFGILSVLCQLYGDPVIVRKVPPSVFLPPPKVDSAIVRWDIFEEPAYEVPGLDFIRKVVRAAFGQRRKKLVNSLRAGFPSLDRGWIEGVLENMGLGKAVRAEQLTVEQFAHLATRLRTVFDDPDATARVSE